MKSKYLAFLLFLFLYYPVHEMVGKSSGDPLPAGGGETCSNASTETYTVYLDFPEGDDIYPARKYVNGVKEIPEFMSNPEFYSSATSSCASLDEGTFYCVVTVTNTECGTSELFVWGAASFSSTVQVPKYFPFSVRVDLYERCGEWDQNTPVGETGRPHHAWTEEDPLRGFGTFKLAYQSTGICFSTRPIDLESDLCHMQRRSGFVQYTYPVVNNNGGGSSGGDGPDTNHFPEAL